MGNVALEKAGGGSVDISAFVPLDCQWVSHDTSYNYPTSNINCAILVNAGYVELYIAATASCGNANSDVYRTWHKAVWDGTKFTVELLADFQGTKIPRIVALGNSTTLELFSPYQGARGYAIFGLKN